MPNQQTNLKLGKKSKLRKLFFWLIVDVIVLITVFTLLLYKPRRYNPAVFDAGNAEQGQVSPYLTHDLSPQLYNGTQRGEPFDMVITQDGINEIIAWSGWPKESEGIILSEPAVLFVPDCIVLMGTANVKGVDFVVSIEVKPGIDEQKLLNLRVSKVKIGAMNITPLAKAMAKKMYERQVNTMQVDRDSLQNKIVASLLNEEAFEPVIKVDGRKVSIREIAISDQQLLLHMVPAL